jgi:hypothetical protein
MMYRLNSPAMAIIQVQGCGVAVTLEIGTILARDGILQHASSSPPVEVECAGKSIRMFPIDIPERAAPV